MRDEFNEARIAPTKNRHLPKKINSFVFKLSQTSTRRQEFHQKVDALIRNCQNLRRASRSLAKAANSHWHVSRFESAKCRLFAAL